MKYILVFIVTIYPSVVFSHSKKLLFEDGFESNNYFEKKWGISGNKRIQRSRQDSTNNNYAAKFTINRLIDKVPYRSEYFLKIPEYFKFNNSYIVEFEVKLDINWADDNSGELIWQMHGRPDKSIKESPRPPPLALEIKNDEWFIVSRYDKRRLTPDAGKRSQGQIRKLLGKTIKDVWIKWRVEFCFSAKKSGFFKVFKNGERVFLHNGPNSYNDLLPPYMKIGIYKWPWNPNSTRKWVYDTSVTTRTIYFDNVRIQKNIDMHGDKCGS